LKKSAKTWVRHEKFY